MAATDVNAAIADEIANSQVTGSSDNFRHGRYLVLVERVHAKLIGTDHGNDRYAFVETTVVESAPNPQGEGNVNPDGKLLDDGTTPNLVGSKCALKVNFDGPGKMVAGKNVARYLLGVIGKRQEEITKDQEKALWLAASRERDAWVLPNGVEVAPNTPGATLQRANPHCGLLIRVWTRAKKKKSWAQKQPHERYVTELNWEVVDLIGQGKNAHEEMAKRRVEIESRIAEREDDDEAPSQAQQVPGVPTNGHAAPPAFPPAPWRPHPDAKGWYWDGGAGVKSEADLRAMFPSPPAVPSAPPSIPSAPAAPAAPTALAFPPAPWRPHPDAKGWYWDGGVGVKSEADLRASR